METYLVEALDYGANVNAVNKLKSLLASINGVTVLDEFYEAGTIEEGAGAGVTINVKDDSPEILKEIRVKTAAAYGVDEQNYRIGAFII